MHALLAFSPFIVIFLLMTWGRRSADVAGALGWLYTSLLAIFYFNTSWSVILLASLAGFVASFPISLMVATSIFQINVMEEAGAIRRVVSFMKTLAGDHRIVQIMLINVGVGTVLAALGATPVSILPPIMLALGYSAFIAVALPAIGYDALCTYALLGVPVVVFADVASGITGRNFTPAEVGLYFAQYMPVVTTLIALGMLWLVGRWAEVRKGWPVALITGITAGGVAIGMNYAGLPTLTGIVAGLAVIGAMLLYLKVTGHRIRDRSRLGEEDLEAENEMSLGRAVLPWLILIGASILTNFKPIGLYDWLFSRWAMPVEIIPGRFEKLRVLWHAYTWVLIATLISIPFYRMKQIQLSAVWRKSVRRVPRPAFAAGVFFAIAFVLNHSGKDAAWAMTGINMVRVLADAAAGLFGSAYAGAAGFLGLLGGFISGSETSSIAMLTKLHFDTVALVFAEKGPEALLLVSLLVAAASGIGGGLASVISPAKLQNAAAVIDKIGLESQVIRSTAVIALVMVGVVAVMTFVFLAFL